MLNLWNLLIAIGFVAPVSGTLGVASHFKVGLREEILAVAVAVALGLLNAGLMWLIGRMVFRSIAQRSWLIVGTYCAAIPWLLIVTFIGIHVAELVLRVRP
jgi:hypothetical protein